MPDAWHDEVDLDEDGTKGENPSEESREKRVHVPVLLGDVALEHLHSNGDFNSRSKESSIRAERDERKGYSQPHEHQEKHGCERDGSRPSTPHEEVHEDYTASYDTLE